MSRLKDRVVIVTGGGHGLGRAYCQGIVDEGGKVVVADIDLAAAERVAGELNDSGGEALGLQVDVSQEEHAQRMAASTVDRFGKIDGLVNNAAVFISVPLARFPSVEETTVEEWDRVMAVNVRGVFVCSKAVIPHMKAARYGKLVNISSTAALQGYTNFGAYPVSKTAVIGITRGLARELGDFNINVNSVAPGGTMSADEPTPQSLAQAERDVNEPPRPGGRLRGVQVRAIRRVERPDDLVGTVLFLLSGDSDFITGQTIVVDGGAYML